MHPAYSIIFFTTASGAGYGLLFLLALAGAAGLLPADPWLGGAGFALALGLATAGLLSSTFHLGHPERAWRAISQWRSSWLSREGVAALVTYPVALAFAYGWVVEGRTDGPWTLAGLATAAMCVVTVICTGMIYASLKPIRRWNNRWVVPNYLALSLMTGAILLEALVVGFGHALPALAVLTPVAILAAWLLKRAYWRFIDTEPGAATIESATGLGHLGKVRLLEPPHTSENYLQREMGYHIARKHAVKLRRIALVLAFIVPLVLALIIALMPPGILASAASILAVLCVALGVVIERWLFFAEARHAVTLYYGASAA
ncbi:MAG: dimethyl sulfoxide reductase anchor subunit family protein [Alphaproteobacteria bacterium]